MRKHIKCLIIVSCCSVFCITQQAISQTISYYQTGEEFSGPLPSWKNVKTDFGAKGDGVTDDAPAITAALYTFKDMNITDHSVLYFPAGIYRLGSTIYNADRAGGGADYAGLGFIGEDPSNTILLWDGTEDSVMFKLDGWCLKVSRLTFDGQNKAKIGIFRDGSFGTNVEYSDLVFKDIIFGVQLGNFSTGQAENLFLRCRFLNCGVGVFGSDMNSLDIWLWYCLFQDCEWGIHLGGYQAYGNVFLRSKICDLGLSWQSASIVNNISVNTKCFNSYLQSPGLFQGNKIYDPDTTIIRADWYILDTLKAFTVPYISVLLDNIVKTSSNEGAAIKLSDGKCISVGNTFTQLWPIRPTYHWFTRASNNSNVHMAVDGNTETYFAGDLFDKQAGIAWHCPSGTAKIVEKYSLTAQTSEDRQWDLKSFRLVGSNDWGYHVTVLDSQMNQSWSPGETKTYTFQNTTPFAIYRLDVMENNNNQKPGDGEYFVVVEFSLLDTAGVNILKDPEGFLAGSDETWGKYYSLHERRIPYDSIANPEIIELPGTPPLVTRRIFEVRKGTPDDAAEIQSKIDSAAALPPGTRPIVHIPKGVYFLNKTIFLPANVDMTLCGDGLWNGGTQLVSDPGFTAPTIRFNAPSHILMRDIQLVGNEPIYAEVDDSPGSRVTGALFLFGGIDWLQLANTAMIIDGIEQSYMLFSGVSVINCHNGVLVKGGPVLSSGGATDGQIAFLGGGSGCGQNIWETQKNGKLIAQGMWHEADIDYTKSFINLTQASSGSLAIGGMTWCYAPNPDRPLVSIDNFSGQFTAIANNFVRYDIPQWWQLTGDGTRAEVFSACNVWPLGSDSTEIVNKWPYWVDQTSPSANASRLFCEGAPEIMNKVMNTLPDSSSVLSSLALMRSLRINKPVPPLPENSHLDFIRVNAYCYQGGTAVRFIASPDPYGRPGSPTLVSPQNSSMDITSSPSMSWNSSSGASSYRLQVSTNTTFSQIVFEDSTISATNQEIGPLINNTLYYWRVLAMNANGSSMWSPVWSFTTGINTSTEQTSTKVTPEFYLFNNFPNPFSESTSISYYIPSIAKVTLTILDIRGKEIMTLMDKEQDTGKYAVTVDGTHLSGGVYFYRLQIGEYSETRKMVLIK